MNNGAGARSASRLAVYLLAALTVALLVAAAVVFAVGWRWSEPPVADVIPVPPTPARQQQAYQIVSEWLDAQNRSDAAGMRALTCADPPRELVDWIGTVERRGNAQGLFFPDAVRTFTDTGTDVSVNVALRVRPLDDRMRQLVEAQQQNGGFFYNQFTLVDENGLKVCQSDIPSG